MRKSNYSPALVIVLMLAQAACSSGGGSDDNPAPEATITFPTKRVATDASQLTVRGTASDADGVAAVRVNGAPATSGDGFTTWRALVPLVPGINELVVETEDSKGNVASRAASAMLDNGPNLQGSRAIVVDSASNRALVSNADLDAVVAVDLDTGARSMFSGAAAGVGAGLINPRAIDVDSTNGQALVLSGDGASGLAVVGIDLASGDRSPVSDSATGSGADFGSPRDLAVDAANLRALVSEANLDAVVQVALPSGDRSALSNGVGSGDPFISPAALAVDASASRALVLDTVPFPGRLVAVDLATGNRSTLSDPADAVDPAWISVGGVAVDAPRSRALLADGGLPGLMAVDLATGGRSILSGTAAGTGIAFGFPRDLDVWSGAGRAVVLDLGAESGLGADAVVLVDLANGDRTLLSGGPLGTGPLLSSPDGLALDAVNARALVPDEDLEGLLTIDLATGDRSVLADASTGTGPSLAGARQLVVDSANDRALVVDSQLDALLAVDLTSGDRVILSGAGTGAGDPFDAPLDLVLDAATGRVLVVDNGLRALISVDLASGDRTTVASGAFGNLQGGVELDAANNRALLLDFSLDTLFGVDLASGAVAVISDAGTGTGPLFDQPDDIVLDAANNRVLVADPGLGMILAVDLDTGDRTALADAATGNGTPLSRPQNLDLDPATGLAVLLDNDLVPALLLLDSLSGDRVIVSQ